jgi:hypothetical protein
VANFVDGTKFKRISGQLVHVPIGKVVKIGLWGGMETSGHLLDVDPDDATVLKSARAPKHGSIFMFLLTGLNLGETTLNAVAADGSSWDSVDIHVHMPRKKQLPAWDDLFDNYAGDAEASDDFRTRIGGDVDNSQFSNTCTLRMSEAFNGAGQPIPKNHPGLYTVLGGDKKNYALRVAEFKQFMLSTYGAPDIVRTPPAGSPTGVLRADFAHLRGVMCFEVHFADATGHFTLWDGTQPVHGDYFSRSYRVSLWVAG